MRRNDLIRALEKIPGNPEIWVEAVACVDGEHEFQVFNELDGVFVDDENDLILQSKEAKDLEVLIDLEYDEDPEDDEEELCAS